MKCIEYPRKNYKSEQVKPRHGRFTFGMIWSKTEPYSAECHKEISNSFCVSYWIAILYNYLKGVFTCQYVAGKHTKSLLVKALKDTNLFLLLYNTYELQFNEFKSVCIARVW